MDSLLAGMTTVKLKEGMDGQTEVNTRTQMLISKLFKIRAEKAAWNLVDARSESLPDVFRCGVRKYIEV